MAADVHIADVFCVGLREISFFDFCKKMRHFHNLNAHDFRRVEQRRSAIKKHVVPKKHGAGASTTARNIAGFLFAFDALPEMSFTIHLNLRGVLGQILAQGEVLVRAIEADVHGIDIFPCFILYSTQAFSVCDDFNGLDGLGAVEKGERAIEVLP